MNPTLKALFTLLLMPLARANNTDLFRKSLMESPLIFDKAGFAYINPAIFHDFFVQDVDKAQAKVLAVVQKPANVSGIINEKSGPPAWKQLPTWYQVSENDHVIPPAREHMFAKQMNATTISLPSSHASPYLIQMRLRN